MCDTSVLPATISRTELKAIKKVGLKIIFLLTLLLVFINLPQILTPCYYWGNPGYLHHMRSLNNDPESYNTYFFGSSRIYRHVDPPLFDELAHMSLTSFNLGSVATYTPESYYLLENFIRNAPQVKEGFIIIELQEIRALVYQNLHTTRVKYYLNPTDFFFVTAGHLENNRLGTTKKYRIIRNYSTSYLEKILGIGMVYDFVSNTAQCIGLDDREVDPLSQTIRGHYSLEAEYRATQSETLKKRYDDLHNDLTVLSSRREAVQEVYQSPPVNHFQFDPFEADRSIDSHVEGKRISLDFSLAAKATKGKLCSTITAIGAD